MPVSPESPHTSNIKWTEQVVLRNREVYTYTHMHALKIKESMNVKESRERI